MTFKQQMRRNLARTLWLAFFQVFLLIMPIAVPFFQSKGLSMQQVFSLQALFALVVLLSEVPSGYVADVLGRKPTLIIGALFSGVGNTVLLFADGFWGLALFEVSLAISHSLVSGADIAMAYDSELVLDRSEQKQREVVGKLYSARTLSEALAAFSLSALLIFVSVDLVVRIQAIIGWIPLLLAFALTEPPIRRLEASSHGQAMVEIWRYLWRHSAVLRLCFAALSIWSLTTFNAVWLLQKLWQMQSIPLAHFGYLWGGLALVTAVAGRYAHRVEDFLGARALLLLIACAPVLGYLLLDRLGVVGGVLVSITFFASRGFGLVILRDGLNRRIPSEFRATANSLASFGFRGAFALTGPLVGYSFDLWGMHATLLLLALASGLIALTIILPLALAVRTEQRAAACGV
ncbi:MAG: MFS transporter [Pseudomonadales bacterium]